MAVTDSTSYHATDTLVLQKPRKHYRVGLRVEHWQLRSQIGLSSKRNVYYVGGNGNTQVHKLDTAANESEIVKILTFAPRCLVVKNGWVACGGENGDFVAFQVPEDGETNINTRVATSLSDDPSLTYIRNYIENGGTRSDMLDIFGSQLSADDRLQLGLEGPADQADANSTPPLTYSSGGRTRSETNNKSLVARSKAFGRDRVNCITLWFPPSESSSSLHGRQTGAYSQSVAVLANNDKKVTIVSLEFQDAVEEVVYPDCVNRALISPDGRLLVAICDDPYLYVHERVPKSGITPSLFGHRDVEDFEWRSSAKVHLASQRKDDQSDQRGSFAACFSNTGRYLAIGTQYGMISVFDTALLLEPGLDPLVATFTSSRPREDVGAIRDMAFCPGPYDLLAWTEHRSRVGIADIRSNYVSRQLLDLDSYDDFEQIMITERGSIDPRLLQRNSRGDLTLADSATPTAASATEGINRRASRRFGSDYHQPLSAEETSVLEALSEHRRRREQAAARNNSSPGPTSTRLLDRLHNRAAAHAREAAAHSQNRDAAASREYRNRVSDLLNAMHDQQAQRLRLIAQFEQLQERAYRLILDEPQWSRDVREEMRSPMPQSTRHNRPQTTDVEPWHLQNTFEAYVLASDVANNRTDDNDNNNTTTQRPTDRQHLASVWTTLLRQRDGDTEIPGSRLARARAQMHMVGRVDREHDDTAGLAWSEDGRVLMIGAEDGIYEFHVDLFSRKLFTSLELR